MRPPRLTLRMMMVTVAAIAWTIGIHSMRPPDRLFVGVPGLLAIAFLLAICWRRDTVPRRIRGIEWLALFGWALLATAIVAIILPAIVAAPETG